MFISKQKTNIFYNFRSFQPLGVFFWIREVEIYAGSYLGSNPFFGGSGDLFNFKTYQTASGEAALRQRNQHIKSINEDGVLAWRRTSGYYRQSDVENMFYRYKTLIGDQLRARGENSRQVESVLACNILNQFRLLGRPESELVAWDATLRIHVA